MDISHHYSEHHYSADNRPDAGKIASEPVLVNCRGPYPLQLAFWLVIFRINNRGILVAFNGPELDNVLFKEDLVVSSTIGDGLLGLDVFDMLEFSDCSELRLVALADVTSNGFGFEKCPLTIRL